MTEREFTVREGSLEMAPWSDLSADRQLEIFTAYQRALQREREEVRFLRSLLLSNGGRTAEEIDKIMWSLP